MKFPNKIISYNNSIISKFPIILDALSKNDYTVMDLYKKLSKQFDSINEYVNTLECLYVLNRVEFENGGIKLHYVEGNIL